MASARNDRLFTDGTDLAQLAKEVRYVISGTEEVARNFRVIALPRGWQTGPLDWARGKRAPRSMGRQVAYPRSPRRTGPFERTPRALGQRPHAKAQEHCALLAAALGLYERILRS